MKVGRLTFNSSHQILSPATKVGDGGHRRGDNQASVEVAS